RHHVGRRRRHPRRRGGGAGHGRLMARAGGGAVASVAAPALAILGAMISTNLGAAFAKGLFSEVGSAGMTALRVGMAALLLLPAWRPWRTPPPRAALRDLAVY